MPSSVRNFPASGTFAPAGNMILARYRHGATLLPDGRVLLAGGQQVVCSYCLDISLPFIAEVYDPPNATFLSVGPIPFYPSQITLLADGKVLIQGLSAVDFVRRYCLPEPEGCRFQSALYDPNRGFRLDEPVRAFWTIVTATLLTTGKVLNTVLDTDESFPTVVAELYDPSTGTFAARKMAKVRRYATATLLPDATVLIAGGGDGDLQWSNRETSGAEVYEPIADQFSRTGSMAEDREGHTATLLPDGTVLIAGGGINLYGTATAEIYHPSVLIPAPMLFSLSGDGRGQGAIWHATTGEIASASNPAIAGEALSMYTTSLVDGGVIPPQVAIGGRLAEVLYLGPAPD